MKTSKQKAGTFAAQRRATKTSYSQKKVVAVGAVTALEEARRAGLLDGEKTEHVSFRAPKALIEAAKRESGVTRPTELGLLALATLAQPDPTAKFLKETRGELGTDHQLDY